MSVDVVVTPEFYYFPNSALEIGGMYGLKIDSIAKQRNTKGYGITNLCSHLLTDPNALKFDC
jgi:hypothetical protein